MMRRNVKKVALGADCHARRAVETGARVRVPPFIEVGQVVRINPETGEYMSKA